MLDVMENNRKKLTLSKVISLSDKMKKNRKARIKNPIIYIYKDTRETDAEEYRAKG